MCFGGGCTASFYCILRDRRNNLRDRFGLKTSLKTLFTPNQLPSFIYVHVETTKKITFICSMAILYVIAGRQH